MIAKSASIALSGMPTVADATQIQNAAGKSKAASEIETGSSVIG
jgi:hypothetical protein